MLASSPISTSPMTSAPGRTSADAAIFGSFAL
jgi:hypothetical protein